MRGSRGGGGAGDPDPPHEKSQIYRVSKQHWSGFPEKLQTYQASNQSWAIIGPPAKRHFNGVSLAGQAWPAFSVIWIFSPLINLKKSCQSWTPSDTRMSNTTLCEAH